LTAGQEVTRLQSVPPTALCVHLAHICQLRVEPTNLIAWRAKTASILPQVAIKRAIALTNAPLDTLDCLWRVLNAPREATKICLALGAARRAHLIQIRRMEREAASVSATQDIQARMAGHAKPAKSARIKARLALPRAASARLANTRHRLGPRMSRRAPYVLPANTHQLKELTQCWCANCVLRANIRQRLVPPLNTRARNVGRANILHRQVATGRRTACCAARASTRRHREPRRSARAWLAQQARS
jgi:hypothetical protein